MHRHTAPPAPSLTRADTHALPRALTRATVRGLALVAGLLLAAGCGSGTQGAQTTDSPAASGFPVTVDNCGVPMTFQAPPTSVLTVGTSAVWNLSAAGAADRLIARSGEFGADLGTPELTAALSAIPVVDPADPTAETIVGTGAELVLGYGLFNTSKEALAELGVTLLDNLGDCGHDAGDRATGFTVDTVIADIERLGQVFGTSEVAAASVAEIEADLAALNARRPAEPATAVIVYYFAGQLGSHGGTNISTDILARANLTSVFADEPSLYLNPSLETIIDADPDYLVIHYGVEGETFEQARDAVLAEPGFADLRAAQAGAVIGVAYDGLTSTPGAVDGIRALLDGREASALP